MSAIRSLEILHKHGSTARVLNLLRVWENHSEDFDYLDFPVFKSQKLNRALFVKHRIRSDEEYLMARRQKIATKIIFPLVGNSLNLGGQSFFVNQKNFKEILTKATGGEGDELAHDIEILKIIDKLPSLDPFLLREQLRRSGFRAADCYFAISPHDRDLMHSFASYEISRLVEVAFTNEAQNSTNLIQKMVGFIMSNEADEHLEPLRIAMGLDGGEFSEGVFAWRGFLYFKWQMGEIFDKIPRILSSLEKIRLSGNSDLASKKEIAALREQMGSDLRKIALDCKNLVQLYDRAFSDLVERAHATAFRKFLLSSPKLFLELGTMMGIVSHIISFWQYRFPSLEYGEIDGTDFKILLRDFCNSLEYDKSKYEVIV